MIGLRYRYMEENSKLLERRFEQNQSDVTAKHHLILTLQQVHARTQARHIAFLLSTLQLQK